MLEVNLTKAFLMQHWLNTEVINPNPLTSTITFVTFLSCSSAWFEPILVKEI